MQEKQFIIKLKGFFFTFKYNYFKNQTNIQFFTSVDDMFVGIMVKVIWYENADYLCFFKFLHFSSWYGTVCGVYCPGATSQSQGLHPAAGGTAGVWCFLGRWKKTKHLNIYISWYQTNVCAISFWKKYFELLLLSSVGI